MCELRRASRYPCQEHVGGDAKIPTVIYYDADGEIRAIGAETLKEGTEEEAQDSQWSKARWYDTDPRSMVISLTSL